MKNVAGCLVALLMMVFTFVGSIGMVAYFSYSAVSGVSDTVQQIEESAGPIEPAPEPEPVRAGDERCVDTGGYCTSGPCDASPFLSETSHFQSGLCGSDPSPSYRCCLPGDDYIQPYNPDAYGGWLLSGTY